MRSRPGTNLARDAVFRPKDVVADVDKAAFRAKLDDIYMEFAKRFGEDRLKAIDETK